MKLTFNVNYHTNWGESLYIVGNLPELGMSNVSEAVKLTLVGEQLWTLEIEISDSVNEFEYSYIVKNDNGYIKNEWGHPHKFTRGRAAKTYTIYDKWQDQPADKPLYSSAIVDCLNYSGERDKKVGLRNGFFNINVEAPMISKENVLAISGGCDVLGNWDSTKAIIMSDADFPIWSVNVEAKKFPVGTQYKFVILNKATKDVVAWEGGDNHILDVNCDKQSVTIISGLRFNNTLPPLRCAGVAIPVFSLRSDEDFGVGDFYDLMKVVDWAELTGQNFIQILPINDTTMTHTWTDSYPYNANSIFALHPMFLRLEKVGTLKDSDRIAYFKEKQQYLNSLSSVDYEAVNTLKNEYVREVFAQFGAEVIKSDDFKNFVNKNASWLTSYAAFCVLRDLNGTADFNQWGAYKEYEEGKVSGFISAHEDDINFVYFQQYHLDKQMKEVRDYAHKHGVAIKGDIPIGISRTSVDAWISPRLFNLDCQAGAPPDDFSVLGQNWGFPTYNWEEMYKDGFAWWKARFKKMSEYFDAYRIDHVLGFFRIWQIPMDAVHGLLGEFNPALPFTPDELRNSYDFWLDVNLHTTPYIMDWFLGDYFGEYVEEVKEKYLEPIGYGRYKLKEQFDTQRKVAEYFADKQKNDKNNRICEALMGLIDNVLFIEDQYEKGKYSPRISAQFTYIYRSLNDYEKWCFDRLYNDFFYHRHNDFWYGKAMWKLPPLIEATDMLTCAEDLGMIPDCVATVMSQLEILSLEIQRMPKDPKSEFGNTWTYPYFSVCTTSTHDMGGIRLWWEENREKTQYFYNNVLGCGGEAPYFAETWVCEKIVDQHLKSPSMLCILPLQDWLSINAELRRDNPAEEQINIPSNSRHYWRYRMHISLQQLLDAHLFNNQVENMIKGSGR